MSDWFKLGGLHLWSRDSSGDRIIASYHPRGCTTWHWCLSLTRRQSELRSVYSRALRRVGQWHDYLKLPFGYQLCLSRQVFEFLGMQLDDEIADLFPGSGAVGEALQMWREAKSGNVQLGMFGEAA